MSEPGYRKQAVQLIKPGTMAPNWELINYADKQKITLANYSGKVILMEFWIKNCGYCIEAVKQLNQLNDNYKKDSFKLLAVNTEDDSKAIEQFIAKRDVKYTVLYGTNSAINKNYGITAFPQVVLINKAGEVIYSGDFDFTQLKLLIDKEIWFF